MSDSGHDGADLAERSIKTVDEPFELGRYRHIARPTDPPRLRRDKERHCSPERVRTAMQLVRPLRQHSRVPVMDIPLGNLGSHPSAHSPRAIETQ